MLSDQGVDIEDEDFIKFYNKTHAYLATLNSNKTWKNVIEIFKSNNYTENVQWNKKIYLLVFEDKVYDLEKDQFVEPNMNGYMNLCTGYKYEINDLTEENKQIIKEDIIKTIKNIFASEEEFNHIMKVISSFLIQTNKEEKA